MTEPELEIKGLTAEFMFAVDCMHAVLSDGSLKWKPRVSPPRKSNTRKLCTNNVVAAIRQLVSNKLAQRTECFFHLWFNSPRNRASPATFKVLGELLTSEFCISGYSNKSFLEFCATIVETAALAYVNGDYSAPDFAVICIFQAICYFKKKNKISEPTWICLNLFAKILSRECTTSDG